MEHRRELRTGVCLELPLRVENLGKAVEAVGGRAEIARVTSQAAFNKEREGLELRLRKDTFHHPVSSINVPANNIVIEIKIPSKYIAGNNIKEALVRAKQDDCPVTVTPILHISTLHKFCGMADFQYYTGNSLFARKINNSVLNGNLAGIQSLSFHPKESPEYNIKNDILPPPRFAVNTQPFYYGYKQSAYVKVVDDESGKRLLVHTAASSKVISNILNWGDPVPDGPPSGLETNPRTAVKNCIKELETLFSERPSYTRRTLQYKLGNVLSRQLKYALPYVSYYYRSGPWRGAYIKYGLNPMFDNSLSIYQVEHFRISFEENQTRTSDNTKSTNAETYLFDGSTYPDAPMLQLCDISDEVLEKYISTRELREEVDVNDGWYQEKTMTIIRKVLRLELLALRDEKTPLTGERRLSIHQAVLASLEAADFA